jgi:hypothetical protein
MRFTKGNPDTSIYSHTSRFNGIDCGLLPKTLLVHYIDSIHFVYSPYLELINKTFKNYDDYENTDYKAYVNIKDKQLVTFKFITEDKKEESILIGSNNNSDNELLLLKYNNSKGSFEEWKNKDTPLPKQEHLISEWDMTTEMMNQNASYYFSSSTPKQTESKESIYTCNKDSTAKGLSNDSRVTSGGSKSLVDEWVYDKEVIKECVDFFKGFVKPS